MRVQGWEHMLTGHIQEAYGMPFQWGTHDCVLWAARWVRLCTGKDFVSEWEGKYKTELGARRLMKKQGWASVADIADQYLIEIDVKLAKRGDILLHPEGSLGVCFARHGFFLSDREVVTRDVTMLDTLSCPKAWAV